MMYFRRYIYRCVVLVVLAIACQPFVKAQETKPNLVQRVASYVDTLAVRGVDSTYIEVPKEPRRIMSVTTLKEMNIELASVINLLEDDDDPVNMNFSSKISSGIHTSTGLRLGYRNLNISYALGFGKLKGQRFTFGMNGNRFGFNFKLRNFKTDDCVVDFELVNPKTGDRGYHEKAKEVFEDPCEIKSLIISAYYIFNHRRFSNAATNSASYIQKRSAGSFILDLSWTQASADFATNKNYPYVVVFHNTGRISMRQINVGLGYAYNWVPLRRLVISASLTPRVSLDNRLTSWLYDVDMDKEEITLREKVRKHSRWKLTGTGRVAMVYNHKRWIFSAAADIQQFRFKNERTKGELTDWSVKANIGWRF